MMNITRSICVFALAIGLYGSLPLPGASDPRVLIVGIDGLRPDALELAATPNIDRLIAGGAYAADAQILGEYRESNTSSGPSWSSILTGVWANKHGVHDNTFSGANFGEFPHFFERVKAARPEAQTISMVSWAPLETHLVSGADIRHVEPLPSGALVDFAVSADEVGIDTRDGEWHHVAGQRRDGVVSLFVNGRRLGSIDDVSGNFDLTGDFYKLGRDARITTGVFKGEKDQVRLWNRALASAELEAIANAGPPRKWEENGAPELAGEGLLVDLRGAIEGARIPISPELAGMTQGDWTLEAWVRITDRGRNIVMGNHIRGRNALNLELHTNNRLRVYMSPRWSRIDFEEEMDGNMAGNAARFIREEDPTAMFVYFHQTDFAGHTLGFSPEVPRYIEAIENVDRHVGRVLDALDGRPAHEDWLVIVCTDHGGLGYRHSNGHDEPEILTVPLIVSGSAARKGRIDEQAYIVDVAATALRHLGIEIDPAWGLDGQPVGLKQ